jgi:hypothetical protein
VVREGDAAAALAAGEARGLLERALGEGPVEVRALGVSMRPWLRSGERILLERRAPRRGDVALVALEGRLLLHRLVRRREGHWLVAGDGRREVDGWVDEADVLAVATSRHRGVWRRLDGPLRRGLGLALASLARPARQTLARLRGRLFEPARWRLTVRPSGLRRREVQRAPGGTHRSLHT